MSQNIVIESEFIQTEAEASLERQLSETEVEEVYEAILEDLGGFIQEKIHRVICFNRMLERNQGAEKIFPHYIVYYRNPNAYRPEFEMAMAFASEADAKSFIHHGIITQFDEWKAVLMKEDGSTQEVYKINC